MAAIQLIVLAFSTPNTSYLCKHCDLRESSSVVRCYANHAALFRKTNFHTRAHKRDLRDPQQGAPVYGERQAVGVAPDGTPLPCRETD